MVHIRERDTLRDSKWLPWWDRLHPPGGVGFGATCTPEPWAAEEGDEMVFVTRCGGDEVNRVSHVSCAVGASRSAHGSMSTMAVSSTMVVSSRAVSGWRGRRVSCVCSTCSTAWPQEIVLVVGGERVVLCACAGAGSVECLVCACLCEHGTSPRG